MRGVSNGVARGRSRTTRAWMMRIATLAATAFALALALPATGAAATPADLELVAHNPTFSRVDITTPTGTVSFRPGRFRLRVTPQGGTPTTYTGFCVDLQHPIDTGVVYPVSLQTSDDDPALNDAASRSVAWLIANADSFIFAAPAPDQGLEAGAIQLAIWQLLGEAVGDNPANNGPLNARADFYVALAAGKAIAGPMTASAAPATGVPGATSTVTLTGSPGTTAALSATGPGTLSASQVTFDASGRASVTVTSTGVGRVTVTASASGQRLIRAARQGGPGAPQTTEFLVPETFTAQASMNFQPAPAATSVVVPSAAVVTPAQRKPSVKVDKSGPRTARAGATAVYTITVVNRGKATAQNVLVSDRLPATMSLTSRRGFQLRNGNPTWLLDRLAPGRSRTFRLRVRMDADARGMQCNAAQVTVGGSTARDKACTRVSPRIQQLTPPVTG